MVFKFSLVSDLHLDFPQPKTPPMEENILVAGDCGNGLVGLKYLNKLKRKGHRVWACTGNHEHYGNALRGRSVEETEKAFHDGLGQPEFGRQRLTRSCGSSWPTVGIGCPLGMKTTGGAT